jgi:serine/threonine protein kinase
MGISKGCGFDGQSHSCILLMFPTKANILIDQTGHARLADFGLVTIIKDPTNVLTSTTYSQGGSARWMSPELIDPQQFGLQHSHPTGSSDCYALGMVIYETISGNVPFHEDPDLTVVVKVVQGKRPPRGGKFRKDLWGMLERCWESQPSSRPSIRDVLWCLEVYSNSL